ncbi:class I SAM-dependent methyltransferase [Muriicola sp.]|uniref:class I SAM-dependent methyltransferase n=1 Tax=Muriicola sp. TaxID=2020856 RepID=UPI003C754CC5
MEFFLRTKDHALTQESFDLQYDAELEMLQTIPKPTEIEKYYQDEAYISHTDGNQTALEKIYQLVKQYNQKKKASWIQQYAKQNAKVLDVGAGTGSLIKYLQDQGWQAEGVEPNKKAQNIAKDKGVDLKSSLQDVEENDFDVITLWHVLEHLPDLDKDISDISKKLRSKGVVFIAVPNFRSYDAQHYGSYWAAYDVPRHCWHFSQHSIQTIFSRKGFSLLKVKPMIFDAFYIARLSEKYKKGNNQLLKALWHGLRSNFHGWRTGEYSSLLYILQKE